VRQEALSRYFGLDPSLLEYSYRDYVVRSSDVLVRFVAGLAIATLILIGAHSVLRALLRQHPQFSGQWLTYTLLAAGIVAIAFEIWRLANPVPLEAIYLLGPASLAFGAVLLVYSVWEFDPGTSTSEISLHLPRTVRWIGAVSVAALVLVAIFWAANDYARVQGRSRAIELAGSIAALPSAVVYSESRLNPGPDGIQEEKLPSDDSHWQYCYRGLRLLIRGQDRYFCLPTDWSHLNGAIVVLLDDGSIRVEFSPGR
jgi:hypothetical protein